MSNLDISKLSAIPLKSQIKELNRIKQNHDSQTTQEYIEERIRIFEDITADTILKNPNYIRHEVKIDDIESMLKNIMNELSLLTVENYQVISAKKTINEIWEHISANKPPDWLSKVKHRASGYIFKKLLNKGFRFSLPPFLVRTYEKLDPSRINFDKTLNKISKQIYIEIWEVMETEFLKNEVSALRQQHITDKVTISKLENAIKANNQIPSKPDWKDNARALRLQGYSIAKIMQIVDKGRTAVSQAVNSAESKAILNS